MIPQIIAPLPAIAALVRAGAVERGWTLFVEGGHAKRDNDPAALAVRGRLLKGKARLAAPDQRSGLFAQAAAAYAAAHALSPAPYLAINAATLSLLAGDGDEATRIARAVLALLDGPEQPADTPYFLAATRAEAHLLLGDVKACQTAMEEAVTHDPDGWADRATTLGQLREIAAAMGVVDDWLAAFAAPASLHFAGHMGLASGGELERQLAGEVDSLIAREEIGFAWGALAAGSDVVIAERLLAAGAQVHVVLPCAPELFEAQSVAPAGPGWQTRYRTVLARAASLRLAAADPGAVHDPLATAHAGELAIGATLLNARFLASRSCQLVVTDADGGGRNTAKQADMWPMDQGPQLRLTIPRDRTIEALFPPEKFDPARELAVHVAIRIDELVRSRRLDSGEILAMSEPVSRALAALDRRRIRAAPGRWELALDDFDAALAVMLDILDRCDRAGQPGPAIGAHVAIASLVEDPASEVLIPYGPGMNLARRIRAMAPPGLALVSDAVAVTMVSRGSVGVRSELYHPGDEESEGAIHVLLPRGQ